MKRPGTIECNQPKKDDSPSNIQPYAVESVSYDHGGLLADSEKVTVKEAAKLMGIADSTVRKLIYQGDLRHFTILTKIVIPKTEIENYLRRHLHVNDSAEAEFDQIPTLPKEVLSSPYLMRAG